MKSQRTRGGGTKPPPLTSVHPLGTPRRGLSANTGALASAAWLVQRGLETNQPKWFAEIVLTDGESRLQIEIYAEEWGVAFAHVGKQSWIRVTDVPFIHGRDDHELLRHVPPLKQIGGLVRRLEREHGVRLRRDAVKIRTTIAGAEPVIRTWVESL